MNLLILTLGLWSATPQGLPLDRWSEASTPQLRQLSRSAQGAERGAVHLLLASRDTADMASLDIAWPVLDSLQRAAPSPLHAALLGTAEALQARRVRDDAIAATRWVGRSMEHLEAAVKGDPRSTTVRIFRIHSLVEVPEIFHVDALLKEDAAFLRGLCPRLPAADPATLLALAAVEYRFGRLTEASALWKLVAGRKDAAEIHRAQARRRLEALRG